MLYGCGRRLSDLCCRSSDQQKYRSDSDVPAALTLPPVWAKDIRMAARLAFLHTAESHVSTFDHLLSELAPSVLARHLVAEPLLAQARAAGGVSDSVAAELAGALNEL